MNTLEEEETTISKDSLLMLLDILQAAISVILEHTSIEGVYGLTDHETKSRTVTWDELILYVEELRDKLDPPLH